MFYLIMKDGDDRRWWDDESGSWGTRSAASRFSPREHAVFRTILPPGGRWVGPCDGTEE